MQPKPDLLGRRAASVFQDESVAEAYHHRPPYPNEAIEILTDLVVDTLRTILDVGRGTGYLARHLVNWVDRVDALDASRPMIDRGQFLPGGDHPGLRWIVGSAEEAPLQPPYALITAGDSLHWMDWDVVMPRFATLLTPHGYLAILGVEQLPAPWDNKLWPIRRRHSAIPNFQYYDLLEGLRDRGLFHWLGTHRTKPVTFAQSLDDYIESFHGRAAFSRERMTPSDVASFHSEVRALVEPFCADTVEVQLVTEVVWGKRLPPRPPVPVT